jgi:hypothetical protein
MCADRSVFGSPEAKPLVSELAGHGVGHLLGCGKIVAEHEFAGGQQRVVAQVPMVLWQVVLLILIREKAR